MAKITKIEHVNTTNKYWLLSTMNISCFNRKILVIFYHKIVGCYNRQILVVATNRCWLLLPIKIGQANESESRRGSRLSRMSLE